MDSQSWVNQRRCYNGDLCTVRYVGKVEGTAGDWLGVEWDDPTRGKHAGEHKGVRYFTCTRKHSTAGSFVRPSRAADKPRGFLEALREKYVADFEQSLAGQAQGGDRDRDRVIVFSSKVVEEVGFDKIRKQQAELEELRIVILDGLLLAGILGQEEGPEESEKARADIATTCPRITDLDLSRNLLTSWTEVRGICDQLKRLKLLKLDSNRFGPLVDGLKFEGVEELHVDDTLLPWDQISGLAAQFPSLTGLSASANQLSKISTPLSSALTTLMLENNEISTLSSIKSLTSLDKLQHLSLRGNCIDAISESALDSNPFQFSPTLCSIDLSRNRINSWQVINGLAQLFPGLQSLRISGNPLFNQSVGPTVVTGMPEKPMTVDEAYMLTLSRLSTLQVLNYSTIAAKDRSNAELYYLSLIGKEISAFPETAEQEILANHPRYRELYLIYGEPVIKRVSQGTGTAVNPRSVAARLVRMVFHLTSVSSDSEEKTTLERGGTRMEVKEIPRSFDTYQVKALVSRLFGLTPFEFRMIWETDELDPVSKENIDIEDEWDSEDEGTLQTGGDPVQASDEAKFVKREVELVDTTKDIGFWFQPDLAEARIRVEVTSRS